MRLGANGDRSQGSGESGAFERRYGPRILPATRRNGLPATPARLPPVAAHGSPAERPHDPPAAERICRFPTASLWPAQVLSRMRNGS